MFGIVEFCESNLASGTEAVAEALEAEPGVDVVRYACLGYCSECFLQPFALVNGAFFTAETPEVLLYAIRRALEADAAGPGDSAGGEEEGAGRFWAEGPSGP
ncbi:MAG: YuzB family protein [Hydrogenibacillus schlegelii]|uniref:YuzB family protein n=1 Tax=Hydrogenibacillus schlegelii TaxID=1484 RepID=A0A947GGP8_HYDSH|nr:YuzB family protein [Hydrogenibacillus schlegelii]